jgi:hypothetical protein
MQEFDRCALVQCRGTIEDGARNLSPYRSFITDSCACPGTAISRKLSRKQERFAKTVTSLFTLLSVLVQLALIVDRAGSVTGAGCHFFCHPAEILILELFDYNFSDWQKLSRYRTYYK